MKSKFDCTRSCQFGEVCRFNSLFAALGESRDTNSLTMEIQLRVTDAANHFRRAVERLGGVVLGKAASLVVVKLPSWEEPVELELEHPMKDWGEELCPNDRNAIAAEYIRDVTEQTAIREGWGIEDSTKGIRVLHPAGGYMDVNLKALAKKEAGPAPLSFIVEAFNFEGNQCHVPVATLANQLGHDQQASNRATGARARLG